MEKINSPLFKQLLAASSCGLLTTGLMTSWGYPAAALPQMEHPNSTIHFTSDQASWFATVTLLMSIPGSLAGSVVCECIGPRRLFLTLAPPFCFFFMLMGTASWSVVQQANASETLLLVTRVIQASLVALLTPIASVYTYEISGRQARGTLTSLLEIWCTLGFLLCYIAGCFLSWDMIAWVLPLITIVPGYLGMLWSPESPHWLARKGRHEQARRILNKYRSSEAEIQEELSTIQNNKGDLTLWESLQTVAKKSNLLATIASSGILSLKELIGSSVILIYVVHIFDAAGVGLEPKKSSVIIGFVRIVCNGFATALLYSSTRKRLLVGGNALAAASSAALGLFFYLQSKGHNLSWFEWVPLFALTMHVIASSTFVNPTSWVAAVEVLPGPVRSVGFGFSVMSFSITAFIFSKSFVYLQSLAGMYGIFWIFSGGSLCFILLTICYIPETFGRSSQDIEDHWNNSRNRKNEVYV